MEAQERKELKRRARWSIAIGVLMIILGIIAIVAPLLASIAVGLYLGWLFIVGGMFQATDAFQHHESGGSLVLKLLLGVLSVITGILLIVNPWAGVVSLTLIVGIYFFTDGVFRVFLAFRLKPAASWSWVLLNGILMIILGILIWSQWPFNATWVLGFFVGVGLLFSGITTIVFAAAVRQALHKS